MKIAACRLDGNDHLAIATGEDLEILPAEFRDIVTLATEPTILAAARVASRRRVPVDAVTFLPPVARPEKILCVGINYADHAAETSRDASARPSLFVRFPSSQVGHLQPIVAPSISEKFDYEGELAVIIGRPAWRVSRDEAMHYVAGYSCFAENSARDFQSHAKQVTAGKNFVASGAFGPYLTTADEVPDPRALTLRTLLNGVVVQHASVGSMIFGVDELIEYISSFTRLLPGDVIATGTPAGVGARRTPPLWLKPGDRLEIDIGNVGHLINPVIAENDLSGDPTIWSRQ